VYLDDELHPVGFALRRDAEPHRRHACRPDHPEEACGVFGVYAPGEDVARLTYFGLHALQHRGQESAGIAVGDGETVTVTKNLGLVSRVFTESDLDSLTGDVAIGHTRYSTTGSSTSWENAQPHLSTIGRQVIALAHNGNLVNTIELRDDLKERGIRFRSTTDSEVIATLIGTFTQQHHHIRDGIRETMKLITGAYAVVLVTEEALYAFRDPHGVRPLVLGKLDDRGWVVSSETCGLDIVGAEYVRDIAPGEIIKISANGRRGPAGRACREALALHVRVRLLRAPRQRPLRLHALRGSQAHGCFLAEEAPVEADLVIGVPDSGVPAAVGYAQESGIPYGEGLAKNRYIGRTFISPSQTIRQQGIRLKLNPLKSAIAGKRLVVVDDSIVRGNTTRKLVSCCATPGPPRCTCASRHRR
jgi:amidophosphoribosyltransferase